MKTCKERIPTDNWGRSRSCAKAVWKDGWCRIHHPETVERKGKERQARWDAERAESRRRHELVTLATTLSAKYDLSKLEEAIEKLKHDWETAGLDVMPADVDDFLRAITRETQTP